MPTNRQITALLALALLLALTGCGSSEQSDTHLEVHKYVTVTETEAMELPGQFVPARQETVTLWLGPDLARRDVAGGTLLLDAAGDSITWVDHVSQTWISRTTNDLLHQIAALATADTVEAEDQRLARLQSMLTIAASVTDTGEETEIDGYRCRRWIVEQRLGEQVANSELWLTTDLTVDWELLQRIQRPTLTALKGGPAALAELSRLEGFPVRTTAILTIMGQPGKGSTRLIATGVETLPASHFLPPAGYRPSDGE